MKKAIFTIIIIFILALLGLFVFFLSPIEETTISENQETEGAEETKAPITQSEYCINYPEDRKDECFFKYRRNFICQKEDSTREEKIMVITQQYKGKEEYIKVISSDINRCIYSEHFKEYTSFESGKATYDSGRDFFHTKGLDESLRVVEENCTESEREEDVCAFYLKSFIEYVDSLEETETEEETETKEATEETETTEAKTPTNQEVIISKNKESTVPTQSEYCVDWENKAYKCSFKYRENFVCQNENKTRKEQIMIVTIQNQGQDIRYKVISSNTNRCIYTGYFKEYTSLQTGKATYDLHKDLFDTKGKDGVLRYIDETCTEYTRKEGLCSFYLKSFRDYVESLESEEVKKKEI